MAFPQAPGSFISIETKKKRAKQLYKDKKFVECKQLILEIIANGSDDNSKLVLKLSDICIELNEYVEAEKYYMELINKYPNDALIYMKYGNILHLYLNNNIKAQTMYDYAVKIDPNNDHCWLNYAKLMFKMRKYALSEQYILKCQKERACINYHYAVLLISYKPSQKLKIKSLFEKATILQPNITKYHYQYAQYLANINLKYNAKHEYMIAVELSQYQDISILYDFAKFQYQCLDDYDAATQLLQIAINLDDIKRYKFIKHYYMEIKNKYNKKYNNYDDSKYNDDDNDGDNDDYDEFIIINEKDKKRKNKKKKNKKKKQKKRYEIGVVVKKGIVYRWKQKPKPNGMKILNNLPIRSISKEEENKYIECRICMEVFVFGDKVITLPCFHWQYHDFCLSDWLKDNHCCPICLHLVTKLQ